MFLQADAINLCRYKLHALVFSQKIFKILANNKNINGMTVLLEKGHHNPHTNRLRTCTFRGDDF